jgi:hypothetical protein
MALQEAQNLQYWKLDPLTVDLDIGLIPRTPPDLSRFQ